MRGGAFKPPCDRPRKQDVRGVNSTDRALGEPFFEPATTINKIKAHITCDDSKWILIAKPAFKAFHGDHHRQVFSFTLPLESSQRNRASWRKATVARQT